MSDPNVNQSRWSDHAVEQFVGRLLQVGVLFAALVVLAGGVLILAQHGGAPVSYSVFRGEPDALRSIVPIVRGAFTLNSLALAQLGLLLLIATPIARVAFTLGAFALQRDRTYVIVTAIVLVLLLYGFLYGKA